MQIATSSRVQPNRASSQEVEASFRQIVDASPDAILVQTNNRIAFANSCATKLFGAESTTELLGRSFLDFLHPDTKLLVKARLEASGQSAELLEPFKHQIIALNGSLIRVETTAAPMVWNQGNAMQLRVREVTSRTEFEIRLRETETLFHQLADSMPQIVWMANAHGTVDYHNKKWFEQTRLTEKEASEIGLWKAILHPDDAPLADENWNRCISTGESFQMEYRYKDLKTGGFRWHLGRALPVKDVNGTIIRWFGTCTDIHDQKLAEIALVQAKEQLAHNAMHLEKIVAERTAELEASARSSEALNYSIAHDLRAPLRAMVGFSNALLEEYAPALDLTGKEYAGRIAASARRMDNLIASLLAYGRLNYEELTFGFINTENLLETLLHDFAEEFKAANARVTFVKPFPTVWTNATVLKKIFNELIENALKFHQIDRSPEIEIWAEEQESKSLIWIRDHGIGISPEHHERIFRVLESLHVADKYPGTGIGLAIVRRGVERLGGRIGIKSAPNEGSCFWIELPKALL